MFDPVDALILDLLEWIGPGSRPYSEVIEAWRTSCPRLPVWKKRIAGGSSTMNIGMVSAALYLSLLRGELFLQNSAGVIKFPVELGS